MHLSHCTHKVELGKRFCPTKPIAPAPVYEKDNTNPFNPNPHGPSGNK